MSFRRQGTVVWKNIQRILAGGVILSLLGGYLVLDTSAESPTTPASSAFESIPEGIDSTDFSTYETTAFSTGDYDSVGTDDTNYKTTIAPGSSGSGGVANIPFDEDPPQSGSAEFPFTTAGNYAVEDADKIEVSGGVGKLKIGPFQPGESDWTDSGNIISYSGTQITISHPTDRTSYVTQALSGDFRVEFDWIENNVYGSWFGFMETSASQPGFDGNLMNSQNTPSFGAFFFGNGNGSTRFSRSTSIIETISYDPVGHRIVFERNNGTITLSDETGLKYTWGATSNTDMWFTTSVGDPVGGNRHIIDNLSITDENTSSASSIQTITTTTAQLDSSSWSSVDGVTVTETLNEGNNYYALSFDNRNTWKVWDGGSEAENYRYFRLRVDASNGQAITLGELEIMVDTTAYPTSNMTGNSSPSPLAVSASSAQGSGPYQAFDGVGAADGNWWYAQESQSYPEWIQIDLGGGNAISPTSFKITIPSASTNTSRTPRDFSLLGSNTGSFSGEETVLDSATGETWSLGQTKEYSIAGGAGGSDPAWRSIVRNNSGTWQYNSASSGSETWTSCATNNQESCLSEAFGQAVNQMSGTTLEGLSSANWSEAGGFVAGTVDLATGLIGAPSDPPFLPSLDKWTTEAEWLSWDDPDLTIFSRTGNRDMPYMTESYTGDFDISFTVSSGPSYSSTDFYWGIVKTPASGHIATSAQDSYTGYYSGLAGGWRTYRNASQLNNGSAGSLIGTHGVRRIGDTTEIIFNGSVIGEPRTDMTGPVYFALYAANDPGGDPITMGNWSDGQSGGGSVASPEVDNVSFNYTQSSGSGNYTVEDASEVEVAEGVGTLKAAPSGIRTIVTAAAQLDSNDWENMSGVTVTEVLNDGNIYYAVSFDNRTTFKIWDNTAGAWRSIALLSGDWQYNSGGSGGESWSSCASNDMEDCLSEAFGVTVNQMSGTEFQSISSAQWAETGGFEVGTVDVATGLEADSGTTASPQIDNITFSYGATARYAAQLYKLDGSNVRQIHKLVFQILAAGTSESGDGVTAKIWNRNSGAWEEILTNTLGSIGSTPETVEVTEDVLDYVTADDEVILLLHTNGLSGSQDAQLQTDWIDFTPQVRDEFRLACYPDTQTQGLNGQWTTSAIDYGPTCAIEEDIVGDGSAWLPIDEPCDIAKDPAELADSGSAGSAIASYPYGGLEDVACTNMPEAQIDWLDPVFLDYTGDTVVTPINSVQIEHMEGLFGKETFNSVGDMSDAKVFRATDGVVELGFQASDNPAGTNGTNTSGISGLNFTDTSIPRSQIRFRRVKDFKETVIYWTEEPAEGTNIFEFDINITFPGESLRTMTQVGLYEIEVLLYDKAGRMTSSGDLFVRIVPGNVSQDRSTLEITGNSIDEEADNCGEPQGLVADNVDKCHFRLTLRDGFGNIVSGDILPEGMDCRFFYDEFEPGICLD